MAAENNDHSDVLTRALRKQEPRRGTTNTEKRALSDFNRGRISRDHFSAIRTAPLRPAYSYAPVPVMNNRQHGVQYQTEDIENLDPKLRRARSAGEELGGSGSGYTEGAAFDAVGSDGKLGKVVRHSTYATPSAYPTELRSVASGVTVKANSAGLEVSGTKTVTINASTGEVLANAGKLSVANGADSVIAIPTSLVITNGSKTSTHTPASVVVSGTGAVLQMVDGTKSITISATGIVMTDSSTGKSFTIAFSALTQNVALRADGFCDSGTNKTQLHAGSAPY